MLTETLTTYWPAISLAIGASISTLILAASHWFPTLQRLTRIQAYIIGTVTLWIGFFVWRVLVGDTWTPIGLAIIDLAGGFTVIAAYGHDSNINAHRRVRMIERNDDQLTLS